MHLALTKLNIRYVRSYINNYFRLILSYIPYKDSYPLHHVSGPEPTYFENSVTRMPRKSR